jgi:hypothetical protein
MKCIISVSGGGEENERCVLRGRSKGQQEEDRRCVLLGRSKGPEEEDGRKAIACS